MTLTNERLSEIIKIYNESRDRWECSLEDLIDTEHKVFILDHDTYNGGDDYYSCTFMSKFNINDQEVE